MTRVEAQGFDLVPFANKHDVRVYVRNLLRLRGAQCLVTSRSVRNTGLLYTEYGLKRISWVDEASARKQQAGLVIGTLLAIGADNLAHLQVPCKGDGPLSLDEDSTDAQDVVEFLDCLRAVGLRPYFLWVQNDAMTASGAELSLVDVVAAYGRSN